MFRDRNTGTIRPWLFVLSCTLAVTASVPTARAASEEAGAREPARTAIGRFAHEQPWARVKVNAATGLVQSLSNLSVSGSSEGEGTRRQKPSRRPGGGGSSDVVEGATAFLTAHRAMLLGDRAMEELALRDVDRLANSSHVRYQQQHRGLPVWGAEVAVHMDAAGTVRMLQAGVRPGLDVETTPVLTAEDAIRLARDAAGAATLLAEPKAVLGLLPLEKEVRLAYCVTQTTTEPAEWRLFVDARSGELLQQTNRLMHASGEGLVVEENLFTTPATVSRPFEDLTGTGILQGAFVDVWSFGRLDRDGIYLKRLSQSAEQRFTAKPSDPRFDEQMLYYHINRAHAYFSDTFGFRERDHSFGVLAHLPMIDRGRVVGPMNNAFFAPDLDILGFGDGTGAASGGMNPTSRDADVIYHEYTHAVVHRIVDIIGPSGRQNSFAGALNEAYADYFACTLNDDADQAEYITARKEGLRNLANAHRYPEHVNDPRFGRIEPHYTGLIWGGACWDLRAQLGAATADMLIFRSLYYLPSDGSATFETAAEALLEVDRALYDGAHADAIREVMTRRGIRVPETSTDLEG